ncbi:MAG: Rrf2 family transcriptional regulator [bacterium]
MGHEDKAIYSKPTKVAIRILTHFAGGGRERFHTGREVSAGTGISEPTVAKTLQCLAKEGILESRKGPGGGFRLALPPEQISLRRIVYTIDGGDPFDACISCSSKCEDDPLCPLHDKWKGVKEVIFDFMDSTSVRDMHEAVTRKGPPEKPVEGRIFG